MEAECPGGGGGGGGGLFLASYVFFLVGFSLLVINSYLSKKNKN